MHRPCELKRLTNVTDEVSTEMLQAAMPKAIQGPSDRSEPVMARRINLTRMKITGK
jgi:hypothetical protein